MGPLKFNTGKLASKGEYLLVTQSLCHVTSLSLEPRPHGLAGPCSSCRPLLAIPRALQGHRRVRGLALGKLRAFRGPKSDNQNLAVFTCGHCGKDLFGFFFFGQAEMCKMCLCMSSIPPCQETEQPCERITMHLQHFLVTGY